MQRPVQMPSSGALTLYGNVDIREVDLAFGTSERISDLLVEEGDRVEAGQVLGRLRTEKLQAAVAAAEADATAQQEALHRLRAGSRPEEIGRARALVDAVKALVRYTRLSYERQEKLGQENLASPEEVDQARALADATQGAIKAAEQNYALTAAGARVEDIAEAAARLEARRASLTLARQQLADATLASPAAGIVRDRILEPGDMASPQTPALTLALTEPMWVRAYVPEPDLGRVAPGMSAEVRTDSYPHKVYKGWVGFISPTAEFTPKNVETADLRTRLVYQVRIIVCNPRNELRLGMPATVTIPLDRPEPGGTQRNRCGD
jgi:HlyD family secretion protein